jgi:hypothetical protein
MPEVHFFQIDYLRLVVDLPTIEQCKGKYDSYVREDEIGGLPGR